MNRLSSDGSYIQQINPLSYQQFINLKFRRGWFIQAEFTTRQPRFQLLLKVERTSEDLVSSTVAQRRVLPNLLHLRDTEPESLHDS